VTVPAPPFRNGQEDVPTGLRRARIALVHDWLTGMRGGEKVLDLLVARLPHASVFTMVHVRGTVSARIEARRPVHSFASALPLASRAYRHFLPLFPAAVEQFDLDGFDLVVSTSHCAVKSAIAPGRARHLSYCFTPMRYAWDQFDAYFGTARLGGLSRVMRPALKPLGRWDAETAYRPDRYVAISQYVARRIWRYYNRRSAVVYPPVDTDYFHPGPPSPRAFCLVVSALVPYKRVEVAIEACRLAGLPLKIVGTGPTAAALRAASGPNVEFLGWASDEQVRTLYRTARAVLLPGEEDFGIVPVEAMACGAPVVALAAGGALETVIDGTTGRLVPSPDPAAFAEALAGLPVFDERTLRTHAERFSSDRFTGSLLHVAEELLMATGADARW
jgi:glycosyltransferase involved in cell wall biosynthesis